MIDILLPTFNGEYYLGKQIDSLFCQTVQDWRLLVRDDGSNDNTLCLLKEYSKRNPDKIIIIEDSEGNLGTSGCLNKLLSHTSGEYFMYCDQDDEWEPNKIERSLQRINELEREYPDEPLLVCSDAYCIDENDNIICDSFFESQHFIDVTDDCVKMMALNIVQGSTSIMNKKVLDYMKFLPKGVLHDGWTAVIVAHYGHVAYIHEPLLRYRQHSSNVLGAQVVGAGYFSSKLLHFKKQHQLYKTFFDNLPFKVNKLRWLYYKIIFSLHRI